MSRVDVIKGDKKGTYKVLVNMGMDGSFVRSDIELANQEAKRIHATMLNATLNLAKD